MAFGVFFRRVSAVSALLAVALCMPLPQSRALGQTLEQRKMACIVNTGRADANLQLAREGRGQGNTDEIRRFLAQEERACCARFPPHTFYWCEVPPPQGPPQDPANAPWDPFRHAYPGRPAQLDAYMYCSLAGYLDQPERREGGRIVVEAALIQALNCRGQTYYIYAYRDREAFRVIQPPNWGAAIGGRDYSWHGDAMLAAANASAGPPQAAPAPPAQPTFNCHKYCMDNSSAAPSSYMPCTAIPAAITGTAAQCDAVSAQARSGR